MEMDLVKENHHYSNDNEDRSPERSVSQDTSEICDEFLDPEVSPRVGEEYQVEVPPLLSKSDINWLRSYKEAETQANDLQEFFVGLPVQVMWISKEVHSMDHKLCEDLVEKYDKNEVLKAEQIVDDAKLNIEAMEMMAGSTIMVGKAADLALPKETALATDQKDNIDGRYLVPGVFGEPWSSIEEASFLLGLYIFGKNLVLVKKFVGSKQMGDILSFYYGRFYRSEKYRRWSECRNARGRKCIYGQRLFKGWRQQELVSRLLLLVPEDCKNSLTEVTKVFGDGKMSFEEYVFALKAKVGLEAFVEAVGIGRGKQDLTCVSMDPLKSNHVTSIRPEIPIGKACSALTPLEIVNYLTGDFRLSKARSNDLFWEAVWPRLLARGWHSEQPSNGFTTGTKHSLVFLVPGIKKFSRRRLVRGNHYFDSISDVLGKVALDPGLLELDNNVDKGCKSKEENGWTDDSKVDHEDFPSQQRHCYLKPRTPSSSDIVKFTVVDTSLANGSATKFRELRNLPVDILSFSSPRSYFENKYLYSSNGSLEESDSEEDRHSDKAETVYTSQASRRNKDQMVYSNGHCSPADASNQGLPASELDSTDSHAEVSKDCSSLPFDGTRPRNGIMNQSSQKARSDNKRKPANVTKKRRRLQACSLKSTSNVSVASKPKEEDAVCCSKDGADTSKNVLPSAAPSQKKSSDSSGCSPISSLDGNSKDIDLNQSRTLIDLNLPVPHDAEIDEPVVMEMREGQPDQTSKEPGNPRAVKTSEVLGTSDQQLQTNSRRVGSRNRPPTARALEARALGLLDVKHKRRYKDSFLEDNSTMRPPPQRARPKVRPTENLGLSIEKFKIEDRAVVSSCNSNSISNSNSNSEVLSKLET
ncbi:uncharacterized protein LOC111494564 [Cucurbita maxima]|uniref:Uncharacterized protein LOC111494564 n=1 Tax=Cucurbita maxima TaxID=3661 RepID=A0A6J1KJH6_CUCMA|nr:uncharacterized protein LOC111494564 [Cucurbita maxima]